MTTLPGFDSDRDEALGALLRDHLSAPDDAVFATRMREAAVAAARQDDWQAVARWALPGLAAAALLLAVVGAALGGAAPEPGVRSASGTAAGSLVELAGDTTPVGSGALLAVMTY